MQPPTDDYVPMAEFMLLLRSLNARKMVVLGDVSERWAKDQGDIPSTFVTVIAKSAVRYKSSEATPLGPGWRRQIQFEWQHPPFDQSSNAPEDTTICDEHSVEQLQVACATPGTLDPTALRCAADWILRTSRPGERVVLLGRDDPGMSTSPDAHPLLAMSGQLALTMALRQGLAATAEPALEAADAFYRHQQRQWLQNAGSDLHQRDPALLGGPVHLAAALAASEPLAMTAAASAPVHSRAA